MNHQDKKCYVVVGKCGHVRGASIIEGADPKEIAKTLADWVKRGGVIEQMTVAEMKSCWCDCHKKQKTLL